MNCGQRYAVCRCGGGRRLSQLFRFLVEAVDDERHAGYDLERGFVGFVDDRFFEEYQNAFTLRQNPYKT